MTESRKTKSVPKIKKAAKKTASKAAGKSAAKPATKIVAESSAAPSSSSRAARSAAPKSLPRVIIYTDGACAPNPGLGGWAAILRSPDHGNKEREITGGEPDTTNNRMELLAAVRALEALKRPCLVELHTDSEYLQKAFTQGWLDKWQRNGWRTASKKPVANDDLWRELLAAAAPHQIRWNWVRGHHEDEYNHRADELAVEARLDLAQRLKG